MKLHWIYSIFFILLFSACTQAPTTAEQEPCAESNYLNYDGNSSKWTGGVQMIPIQTELGEFKVWTKRIGNNPTQKVLLLHGGPGLTHELFECFDSYLPKEGIEYIYYDQLGSYYSDDPKDTLLWDLDRFVEEVEQVRIALDLDSSNFFLYGQSWGGILGMQYALKYQDNLKGLIVSNMVPSLPEYQEYSANVLAPMLDLEVQKEIEALELAEDYSNPRYGELVTEYYYTEHILRMPVADWPEPVNRSFNHINYTVYETMQGPSEFGIKGDANLKTWDVKEEMHLLTVPVLSIGATHDTMDPEQMEWLANEVQNGTFHLCENGSHLSQYDDADEYFRGMIEWVKSVD